MGFATEDRRARSDSGLKETARRPFASTLDGITRWSARRVGIAFVHHLVGEPAQDGETHLVARFDTGLFEQQLRYLKRRYRVVPASGLMEAVRTHRRGHPIPATITFDDDLRSHLDVATPILSRLGLPATFFLTGAYLHGPHMFWWEWLQPAFDLGLLTDDYLGELWPEGAPAPTGRRIHDFGLALQAMPRSQRFALRDRVLPLIGSPPRSLAMGADDILALSAQGFEVGFHTRAHERLTLLSDAELSRAFVDGREELEDLAGGSLTTVAYPYGASDARVARAARDAGFSWGFAVRNAPVRPEDDPLLIGRVDPSRRSVGRFAVETARIVREAPRSPGDEGRMGVDG